MKQCTREEQRKKKWSDNKHRTKSQNECNRHGKKKSKMEAANLGR